MARILTAAPLVRPVEAVLDAIALAVLGDALGPSPAPAEGHGQEVRNRPLEPIRVYFII